MKPGLDILNTGHGHAEIHFDNTDPIELERSKRIIEDMLRRGYLLFIEGDDGKVIRVESFDAKTGRYIIGDCALYAGADPLHPEPEEPNTAQNEVRPSTGEFTPPVKRGPGRPRKTKGAVPMEKVRATAMGRSAGG